MKLTQVQKDILLHRLNSGLIEAELSPTGKNAGEVWKAVRSVAERVESGYWEELNDVEIVVLRDAIEGSTWIESMIGNSHRRQIGQHVRAGQRLAEMATALTGRRHGFPTGGWNDAEKSIYA